ncbi:hypothetical protein ACZ87_00712, partial [Candidatus Erwinia dacicola]
MDWLRMALTKRKMQSKTSVVNTDRILPHPAKVKLT